MLTHLQEKKSSFIKLSGKTFASYSFIYKLSNDYSLDRISELRSKNQLLFQKIEERNHQLNLIYVDSVFADILADVTLEVLFNNVRSFIQYLKSNQETESDSTKNHNLYFRYKFLNFIHMLLYSDLASNTIFNGNEFADRVYFLKMDSGKIDYYSIYEQSTLKQKLLEELLLEIDYKKSHITGQEVKLYLRILFPSSSTTNFSTSSL